MNLEQSPDIIDSFFQFLQKRKWWILFGIISIQIAIYFWAYNRLNHPTIKINKQGISFYAGNKFPNAEEKFIETASYNFRKEVALLNLGLNYYQKKDFEESNRVLDNLISSNRFFWEVYNALGYVLFDWGHAVLDKEECNYDQTEILWKLSEKKFLFGSYIAFFKISPYREAIAMRTSMKEVQVSISKLPEWKENCLNPPKDSDNNENSDNSSNNPNSENNQSQDNSNGDGDNKDNSDPDKNKRSDQSKNEENKSNNNDNSNNIDKNQNSSNKESLSDKREKNREEREEKKKNLEISNSDKEEVKKALERMQKSNSNKDYTRHKEEINIITSVDEIEEAMKNAKW